MDKCFRKPKPLIWNFNISSRPQLRCQNSDVELFIFCVNFELAKLQSGEEIEGWKPGWMLIKQVAAGRGRELSGRDDLAELFKD